MGKASKCPKWVIEMWFLYPHSSLPYSIVQSDYSNQAYVFPREAKKTKSLSIHESLNVALPY
jgi:hypothetical protein